MAGHPGGVTSPRLRHVVQLQENFDWRTWSSIEVEMKRGLENSKTAQAGEAQGYRGPQ